MEGKVPKKNLRYSFQIQERRNRMNTTVFFVVGLIDILLIAYFVYIENYLASTLFLFIGVTIGTSVFKKKPGITKYKIRNEGVQVNSILYPYEYIKSFWIFYDPPYQVEVSFLSKKFLTGHIKVPFGEEDPAKIREFLVQFIPEKKQEESLTDIFTKLLGL